MSWCEYKFGKDIKVLFYLPAYEYILYFLISFIVYYFCSFSIFQFIWFVSGLFLLNNIISIKLSDNESIPSSEDKILNSLKFTPKVKYNLIMYCALAILDMLPVLCKYYVFVIIAGIVIDMNIDRLKNIYSKGYASTIYCIILSIYVLDLVIVYNTTVSIFKLFNLDGINKNVLLYILQIFLTLRLEAKYKWMACLGCLFAWIIILFHSFFTISCGTSNLVWLVISTLKFSYRDELDKFIDLSKKNTSIEKIKEIAWENAGQIPTYVWHSIKTNAIELYNDPIKWYQADGFSLNGMIDKINHKEENIKKFTHTLQEYENIKFTYLFSKYSFLLSPFIIFITTISKCKTNYLEYCIIPIILITYLLNIYFYSDFTKIEFNDRIINLVICIEKYTETKSNIIKNVIHKLYITKTTTEGTLNGCILGGILGITLGYTSLCAPTTLLGAGLGGLYYYIYS